MTSPIDNEALAPSGDRPQLPALGSPEPSPAFLSKVKEAIEILTGRRGASNWDRAVTFRDLYESGLASPGAGSSGLGGAGAEVGSPVAGIPATTYRALVTNLERELRNSAAFKELQRKIGSAEDLGTLPDELRSQLSQALADVARARQADIQTVEQKVQTVSMSLASRLTEITASLGRTAAGVREFSGAFADGIKAVATKITQVVARLDDVDGSGVTVEEKFLAQADAVDGLQGQWSIKIQAGTDANPVMAGIGLSVDVPTSGPSTSAFSILADKFGIFTSAGSVMPFGVDASGVYINGTLRVNAGGSSLATLTAGMINFVGDFASAPAVGSYRVNDVYKNTTDGNSYILKAGTPNVWSVFIAKGTSGTSGTNGTNGTNGQRGTVSVASGGVTSWSDSAANAAISGAGYGSPVNRDQVTLYGTGFSQTRFYDSGSWLTIAAYINGNMVVDGTFSATKISGGTFSGASIDIGSGKFTVNSSSGLVNAYNFFGYNSTFGNLSNPSTPSIDIGNSGISSTTTPALRSVSVTGGPAIQVSGGTNGNAINITGGANGIVQNGGGANFMKSILAVTDNSFDLGGASNRFVNLYATSGVINTSDARTKTAVKDADLGLAFINDLRPVKYRQKVAQHLVEHIPRRATKADPHPAPRLKLTKRRGERYHYGLLAQEVRATLGTHGAEDAALWILADKDDPDSQQGLRYDQFIPILMRAVQELSAELDALKKQMKP
jgi:hypothetical protein